MSASAKSAPAVPVRRPRRGKAEEPILPEIVLISKEDRWEEFDRESRSRLGMSGEQVLAAFATGEFDERIEEEDILTLSFLQAANPRAHVPGDGG